MPSYTRFYDTRPRATEKKNFTSGYDTNLIRRLAIEALRRGQNPYEVVAQGIQESGLGRWDNPENPLHLAPFVHLTSQEHAAKVTDSPYKGLPSDELIMPVEPKDNIDKALNYKWYLQNIRYPNDPDKALQAYQGLGILTKGRDMWSGETQDASKTRPYVTRIKALEQALRENSGMRIVIDRAIEDYQPRESAQPEERFWF